MHPVETLMQEHEVILLVASAARREANRIRQGQGVDRAKVAQILDFVRTFADACHHGKEEDLLFTRLETKGFSREMGPVAVMLFEHEQGRGFVRQAAANLEAAAAGDSNAANQVAQGLAGWADLIEQHIDKENNVLFPMAQQILSPSEAHELEEAFAKVERERFAGVHERYQRLAQQLVEG